MRLYDSEPLKVQLDLLTKLSAGIAMERMHRDLDRQLDMERSVDKDIASIIGIFSYRFAIIQGSAYCMAAILSVLSMSCLGHGLIR